MPATAAASSTLTIRVSSRHCSHHSGGRLSSLLITSTWSLSTMISVFFFRLMPLRSVRFDAGGMVAGWGFKVFTKSPHFSHSSFTGLHSVDGYTGIGAAVRGETRIDLKSDP